MIIEGVITTQNGAGEVNVAPMGPIVEGDWRRLILRPFKSSTTYRNLKDHGEGVFHVVDDVELLARGAVGGLKNLPAMQPAAAVRGWILSDACRWYAFRAEEIDERFDRVVIPCNVVASGTLRDFLGFNRAKHAVIEAAIVATRIHLLSAEEILAEMKRLEVAVEKTGGEQERRAERFLREYLRSQGILSEEDVAPVKVAKP